MLGVQIAKRYGAQVTGIDSAPKLAALEAVGFDHVMDYHEHDFTSDGRRYDLILDTKSARSPFRHVRALAPGGRYVSVGGEVSRLLQTACASAAIAAFTRKQARVVALKPNKDLAQLNQLFETAALRCPIDGPYPLSEVPRAVQRFGDAEHVGKVVITVSE